jgi:predicted DNA-binding antitoxin AbrB/MazE fold protein
MTVRAIYENGVFRPTEPVDLPENSQVQFEPTLIIDEDGDWEAQKRVYELLGMSMPSGETDVAERHNEHQTC